MSLNPSPGGRLDRAASELELAPGPTPELFWNVAADACARLPLLVQAGKAARLRRLVEAGALTEAALALIELELPGWQLRRLVLDDGEWHCALSRHPELPIELDDLAEGRHANLSLAILTACVEALRSIDAGRTATMPAVPVREAGPIRFRPVCCDNFR